MEVLTYLIRLRLLKVKRLKAKGNILSRTRLDGQTSMEHPFVSNKIGTAASSYQNSPKIFDNNDYPTYDDKKNFLKDISGIPIEKQPPVDPVEVPEFLKVAENSKVSEVIEVSDLIVKPVAKKQKRVLNLKVNIYFLYSFNFLIHKSFSYRLRNLQQLVYKPYWTNCQ